MSEQLKPGYKESEFQRGVAVDIASLFLAFQSSDWRVQCVALVIIGAINVSYNLSRGRQKEAAIAAAATTKEAEG